MKVSRRKFIKLGGVSAMAAYLQSQYGFSRVLAVAAAKNLSDPAQQPKFANPVPDALAPGFIFEPVPAGPFAGQYNVVIKQTEQFTGLVNRGGQPVSTPVWGYGYDDQRGVTWPGRTFQVKSSVTSDGGPTHVKWDNQLVAKNGKPLPHLLPVDTNLHWAFSLHGYENYSIAENGVPIITHLHGGHTDFEFDGNPEFFYTPDYAIVGPQWAGLGEKVYQEFVYDNDQPAGNLWYHDHALGITRLNVYAGLAGFYFIRDDDDTGMFDNPLGLPVWPYEKAYAIQDRMFEKTGELFYPAFPGDPFYEGFIVEEGAELPPDLFPGGGPTALAEFFGDHMVVNGIIWPYENVEPRNYRMHLLNGTDSRFMALQFFEVPAGATDFGTVLQQLDFTVIGSDQGLASSPTTVETLLSEPGSRYDIIIDFKQVTPGNRVIMKNIGGDEPFGGDIPGPQVFSDTDRVMAFDVVLPLDSSVTDVSPTGIAFGPTVGEPTRTRKVALFEGLDEFGRLQPLLGTAEPATDYAGNPINWPDTPVYSQAVLPDGTPSPLVGQMEGSIAWHSPTTENPALHAVEEWEIWNMTGDAHPIHLHLVNFKVVGRQEIVFDSNADEDGFIPEGSSPEGDGAYLEEKPTVQHNSVAGDPSTYGLGFRIGGTDLAASYGDPVAQPEEYVENAPKDMVTALPGQITRIQAVFDKPGRYVWHCHILSHEDHEMMRVLYVGPVA